MIFFRDKNMRHYVFNFFSEGEEPDSPSSESTWVRFRALCVGSFSLCGLVSSGWTTVSSSDSEETWRFSLTYGATVRCWPFTPGLHRLWELLSTTAELLHGSPLSELSKAGSIEALPSVLCPSSDWGDAPWFLSISVLSLPSSLPWLAGDITGLGHTKSEGLRLFSSSLLPPVWGLICREFCSSLDEEEDRSSIEIDG